MNEELIYRRHVRPTDLNSSNRLFGGQMLSWIDESAAAYAMCYLKTTSIVTARISEVSFIHPAYQNDILEFFASISKTGKTSITVNLRVEANRFTTKSIITTCSLVFVVVDKNGRPTPHNL